MRTHPVLLAATCGLMLLLAACSGGDDPQAGSTTAARDGARPAATERPVSSTPLSGPDAVPTGWPAEAPAEHGAQQWAVYLAVGPAGDPQVAEAAAFLRAQGYTVDEGRELGCDVEAPEALRRDRSELAVAVYFEWREQAGDFLARLKPPGGNPEESRGFVEMLRITRDCVG